MTVNNIDSLISILSILINLRMIPLLKSFYLNIVQSDVRVTHGPVRVKVAGNGERLAS